MRGEITYPQPLTLLCPVLSHLWQLISKKEPFCAYSVLTNVRVRKGVPNSLGWSYLKPFKSNPMILMLQKEELKSERLRPLTEVIQRKADCVHVKSRIVHSR